MSYTEINSKYISKTRKDHECEWCGTTIDIGSEAWYRFYEFDSERHSAYMHPECTRACHMANADLFQDLQDGWQKGDYNRGEWISCEDYRYPHRSTWQILRSIDAFADLKVGNRIHSSIAPEIERVIDSIDAEEILFLPLPAYPKLIECIDRDQWVLDDWRKIEYE